MGADLGKFEAFDLQSHKARAYSKQQKEEFELLKNLTIFFNRPKSIYGVRALPADVYLLRRAYDGARAAQSSR